MLLFVCNVDRRHKIMRYSMKNRKMKKSRFAALVLVAAMMTLTLAGCRKSGGNSGAGTKDGFVYVPEYIQIDFGLNSENRN